MLQLRLALDSSEAPNTGFFKGYFQKAVTRLGPEIQPGLLGKSGGSGNARTCLLRYRIKW